ncbi:MAG: hypothetical protein HZB85_05195 [Deltaproteobacteria bacterium]|nr:hypothetical protein [Deltaproteobacteria bacterium]
MRKAEQFYGLLPMDRDAIKVEMNRGGDEARRIDVNAAVGREKTSSGLMAGLKVQKSYTVIRSSGNLLQHRAALPPRADAFGIKTNAPTRPAIELMTAHKVKRNCGDNPFMGMVLLIPEYSDSGTAAEKNTGRPLAGQNATQTVHILQVRRGLNRS